MEEILNQLELPLLKFPHMSLICSINPKWPKILLKIYFKMANSKLKDLECLRMLIKLSMEDCKSSHLESRRNLTRSAWSTILNIKTTLYKRVEEAKTVVKIKLVMMVPICLQSTKPVWVTINTKCPPLLTPQPKVVSVLIWAIIRINRSDLCH
jgi:hypothetical protein